MRIPITLTMSETCQRAHPVAWALGNDMPDIIDKHKSDRDCIALNEARTAIIVRTPIYMKYLSEAEQLVEQASRTLSGHICILCTPDPAYASPAFIRIHGMNTVSAIACTVSDHYPSITLEIKIQQYTLTEVTSTTSTSGTVLPN